MWLMNDQEEGKTGPNQWLFAALPTPRLVRKRKLDIVVSSALDELKITIGNYLPKEGWSVFYQTFSRYWENKCSHEYSWNSLFWCEKPKDLCFQVSHCSAFLDTFVRGLFCLCEETAAGLLTAKSWSSNILTDPQWWIWGFPSLSSTTVASFSQDVPPCCVPSGFGSYLKNMVFRYVRYDK